MAAVTWFKAQLSGYFETELSAHINGRRITVYWNLCALKCVFDRSTTQTLTWTHSFLKHLFVSGDCITIPWQPVRHHMKLIPHSQSSPLPFCAIIRIPWQLRSWSVFFIILENGPPCTLQGQQNEREVQPQRDDVKVQKTLSGSLLEWKSSHECDTFQVLLLQRHCGAFDLQVLPDQNNSTHQWKSTNLTGTCIILRKLHFQH